MELKTYRVYTKENMLRVGKRQNNKKRSYILVNPLQGKHIPVSPAKALNMMKALGEIVRSDYPKAKLVVGFAETATAVGAIVASCVDKDAVYIHTTREEIPNVKNWLEFLEEHSHAPEQKLCADSLGEFIDNTDAVVFVDDEISTGKTLLNIVKQMKAAYPSLTNKNIVLASLINRLSKNDKMRLESEGIKVLSLLYILQEDYTEKVRDLKTTEAVKLSQTQEYSYEKYLTDILYNPVMGVKIGDYINFWKEKSQNLFEELNLDLKGETLVLGTEENMLPGLILGKRLEDAGYKVYFHATTRSPISVSNEKNYPIQNGYQIESLYDTTGERKNFIYNLRIYSHVIIASNTERSEKKAIQSLLRALAENGCENFIYIGKKNVRDI